MCVCVVVGGGLRSRLLDFMHACLPSLGSCEQQALRRMCHVIIHHQGPMNGEQHDAFRTDISPVPGRTTNVVCLSVHACLCVCGMSLCISLCLCETGGGINKSAGERRWANEQARANFCVCMKPTTSLWGIFNIVFQHLQQELFLIQYNRVCAYVFHAHAKCPNKHAH